MVEGRLIAPHSVPGLSHPTATDDRCHAAQSPLRIVQKCVTLSVANLNVITPILISDSLFSPESMLHQHRTTLARVDREEHPRKEHNWRCHNAAARSLSLD
jgi:hypothetical protein